MRRVELFRFDPHVGRKGASAHPATNRSLGCEDWRSPLAGGRPGSECAARSAEQRTGAGGRRLPRPGQVAGTQLQTRLRQPGFEFVTVCVSLMTDIASRRSFGANVDAHGSAVGEGRPASFATRPVLQGTLGMVAAGHYLAAAIGLRLLEAGGNAIDAGVATDRKS